MYEEAVPPRIQVSRYDVLLDEDDDSKLKLIDMDHVGNERIQVFLNLHCKEYAKSKMEQNQRGMEQVVDTILKIVCSKCIRYGRFLGRVFPGSVQDGEEPEWMDLGQGPLTRMWLHQALSNVNVGEARDNTYQPYNNSHSSLTTGPLHEHEGNLKCLLKRQRRGSHASLRRAASEGSILQSTPTTTIWDENRAVNGLVSSRSTKSVDQVVIHQPMDVVFASCPNGLAPTGNPGNARLQVMVGIHASSFNNSDMVGRRRILEDLTSMVRANWYGRFLVQTSQNSHEELSTESASAFLQALLLDESAATSARIPSQSSELPSPPLLSLKQSSSKRSLTDSLTASSTKSYDNGSNRRCVTVQSANMNIPSPVLNTTSQGDGRTSALEDVNNVQIPSPLRNANSLGNGRISSLENVCIVQPCAAPKVDLPDNTGSTSLWQLMLPSNVVASTHERLHNAAILFLKAQKKKRMVMERSLAGQDRNCKKS